LLGAKDSIVPVGDEDKFIDYCNTNVFSVIPAQECHPCEGRGGGRNYVFFVSTKAQPKIQNGGPTASLLASKTWRFELWQFQIAVETRNSL
jgi:hypothetical protein